MIQSETLELLEWHRLCRHLSTFAATKLGAVAAAQLKIPASKQESIDLLAQTKEVYAIENSLDRGLSFQGIEDIGAALERAELGGMLSEGELLAIATTLAGMRRLRRTIENFEEKPVLQALVAEVRTYPEIEQEIHHCIDDDGKVADRASPKLGDIRRKTKSLREKIYTYLQRIVQKNPGSIQEQVITQRSDRFVIPVKAPQKDTIPGIIHDTSSTGATLYIEPNSVVQLGNQLRQYQRQEQREIDAILQALTEKIAAIQIDLEKLLIAATTIDLATAKARYSFWIGANCPRFIDTDSQENITLRKLRHPLLIWQQKHEQGLDVVPIDVQIQPQIKIVAITGPNTGGKTVTLKTLGLAALMAKVGLFVPAKEPVELPWFEQILADIGDEQSIEQSLSTFSGHICRITRIIAALQGKHQSLVLLDEVGAGTDPAEGSALAIAILKYLAEKTQLTVATTHYGELKALKYQDERFENASVEFNDVTLSPTYKLLWGIPGRSNALTIAQRLGLKSEIIDRAKEGVGELSADINQVISHLEKQRREQEEKANEAGKLLQKAESFYQEVSEKANQLKEREKELKLNQEIEINKAIGVAKEEIARVIRQLQQGGQTAQNAQKATESLEKIADTRIPKRQKNTARKPEYKPQIGEKVKIPSLGQTGEIISISEDGEQINVRFGLMKMTLAITDIESLDGQKVQPAQKPPKSKSTATKTVPKTNNLTVRTSRNTLDLRGARVANAEIELDRAIATEAASGTGALWIIHGKGTGKLRQGVQDFLKSHPQVDRFELASQKEGGSGVTIAYLK
ncbi:MAG: endonuclease MutS2 [Prochloraceae cyanobacterium]